MRGLIIIFILSLFAFGCTEQECCVMPQEVTMIGTWKLSKLCFSNGASSCDLDDLRDADYEEIITFSGDGSFTFNNEGDICSGQYSRSGEIDVDLIAESGNCNFDETVFWLTSLTDTEMIFSPRCIEGCPHLYIRQ